MNKKNIYQWLTYLIAAVWLINGLFCKVLHLVPRHQQIVAQILGETHAPWLTILIGFSEIIMTIWILSKFQARLNAILQIVVVLTMNVLEFILVPDLLLWGHYNALFALVFVGIVYYKEFVWSPSLKTIA
ncbi:MAG: DoxX-like family protein [Aureispira sp.]